MRAVISPPCLHAVRNHGVLADDTDRVLAGLELAARRSAKTSGGSAASECSPERARRATTRR
ncbi:hypothetical protein [Enhygromyxa salina]|uniref:hypothetical protein n=1 Tax=Enhygromyxa salina TaxID=215803 RepID=UPI000D087B89|nr:hypothetical protein [Enhygromyxa salina]